jgi:hypothetical protein
MAHPESIASFRQFLAYAMDPKLHACEAENGVV